jgi:DnaJ-class molecular chaperone
MKNQQSIIDAVRKSAAPAPVCHMCLGEGKRYSHRAGHKVVECVECKGKGTIPKEV